MALSLPAMFSYATTPPQALARFAAAKQERPADHGQSKKRPQSHDQPPPENTDDAATVGAHVDTSA